MSCDAPTLMTQAKCFDCIPPGMQEGVQTYLLASIAGGSMDPATLIQEAKCFTSCLPPSLLESIKTHLLCEIVESISPTPPVAECIDSDAQAFVTAAGITDETQIYAVCRLVTDLKTYPAVGTKYWDREVLIYPFVGGTALAHSINLKNPGGANNLVFAGGVTHGPLGITGDGATAYADTQFSIPAGSQNSFRAMVYIQKRGTAAFTRYWGATGAIVQRNAYLFENLAAGVTYGMNDNTLNSATLSAPGIVFVQRQDANNLQLSISNNNFVTGARVSTGIEGVSLYLLARNNNGVVANFSNATISGFSAGTPIINDVERVEYKGIWDTFETRLGRGHP